MSVIKHLRKLLHERDIDYWCAQRMTFWNCDDGRECLAYTFESDGIEKLAIKVLALTPEQAIAATVDNNPNELCEWRSIALGLFDALEKADLETARQWLGEDSILCQEIAYGDAEAATVGAHSTTSLKMSDKVSEIGTGTCKNIAKLNKEGVHGYYFACSECGLSVHASFDIYETEYTDESLESFFVGKRYTFERCPRCSAKVVSE